MGRSRAAESLFSGGKNDTARALFSPVSLLPLSETRVARRSTGEREEEPARKTIAPIPPRRKKSDEEEERRKRGGQKGLMRVHNSCGNAVRCTTGSHRRERSPAILSSCDLPAARDSPYRNMYTIHMYTIRRVASHRYVFPDLPRFMLARSSINYISRDARASAVAANTDRRY